MIEEDMMVQPKAPTSSNLDGLRALEAIRPVLNNMPAFPEHFSNGLDPAVAAHAVLDACKLIDSVLYATVGVLSKDLGVEVLICALSLRTRASAALYAANAYSGLRHNPSAWIQDATPRVASSGAKVLAWNSDMTPAAAEDIMRREALATFWAMKRAYDTIRLPIEVTLKRMGRHDEAAQLLSLEEAAAPLAVVA